MQKLMSIFRQKSGTTMVELLVAFVVVTLSLTMFSKIMLSATQQLGKSRKAMLAEENFTSNYLSNSRVGMEAASSVSMIPYSVSGSVYDITFGNQSGEPISIGGKLMKYENDNEESKGVRYYYEAAD